MNLPNRSHPERSEGSFATGAQSKDPMSITTDVPRQFHGILRLRSARLAASAPLPMNLPRLIEHDDAGGIVREERPRRSVALQSCASSMQPSPHSSGELCYGHRVQFIPHQKSRPRVTPLRMTPKKRVKLRTPLRPGIDMQPD